MIAFDIFLVMKVRTYLVKRSVNASILYRNKEMGKEHGSENESRYFCIHSNVEFCLRKLKIYLRNSLINCIKMKAPQTELFCGMKDQLDTLYK